MKTKEWASRRPQHLLARAVCLLLAVVAWLCVMRIAPPTRTATVNEISIRVVDSDGVPFTGALDNETLDRVRIKGTKEVLAATSRFDISAYVNMADLIAESALATDDVYIMTVYFKTPEGVVIDGSYNVTVRLREKA